MTNKNIYLKLAATTAKISVRRLSKDIFVIVLWWFRYHTWQLDKCQKSIQINLARKYKLWFFATNGLYKVGFWCSHRWSCCGPPHSAREFTTLEPLSGIDIMGSSRSILLVLLPLASTTTFQTKKSTWGAGGFISPSFLSVLLFLFSLCASRIFLA